MQVWMSVGEDSKAWLGNNGILLHIADNDGRHVGRLRIGQATIEWCPGKVRLGNGRRMKLNRFVNEVLDEM